MFKRTTMSQAMMVLVCSLILNPCAWAQPGAHYILAQGPQRPQQAQQAQGQDDEEPRQTIDRKQASEIARRAYGGRVINVRLENGEWRVRLDDEGTVFDVYVNATSGRTRRP